MRLSEQSVAVLEAMRNNLDLPSDENPHEPDTLLIHLAHPHTVSDSRCRLVWEREREREREREEPGELTWEVETHLPSNHPMRPGDAIPVLNAF